METKPFKLEKEFATKWLAALRSGEYRQGESRLVRIEWLGAVEPERIKECAAYCCLGLAGRVCGIDEGFMTAHDFITQDEKRDALYAAYPDALVYHDRDSDEQRLPSVLASLNDGTLNRQYNPHGKKHSFAEIADWIEENVELV